MAVSSYTPPMLIAEGHLEVCFLAKRNGGLDQSRRFISAWKCVCFTTAFFLLPSCGRISLFSFFPNHMNNYSNHNDCSNYANQGEPCVYDALEHGVPFYIFR